MNEELMSEDPWLREHRSVEWVNLQPTSWRTTHVLKPDLRVLVRSIRDFGWLAPIIVTPGLRIIDGFHRWIGFQNDKESLKRHGPLVPVVVMHVDEIEAMIMHVLINLPNGHIQAKRLSLLIKRILRSNKYDAEQLQEILQLHPDEMDLLLDGDLLKVKKIKEHKYSKAWVPVEATVGAPGVSANAGIERPPNADR